MDRQANIAIPRATLWAWPKKPCKSTQTSSKTLGYITRAQWKSVRIYGPILRV